ncbi:MAG TPA: NAD-dependent epimerase/dehydratase family protein [Gaiellaceae bacterium]|nr:NAD-dependent epimerase/dehydratase family protein [Gaiellaceae bacterium]
MKLLVLGGTVFLGRHVVAEALAAGHDVTIFTRGQTNPGLFPDAERLIGDRDGNLDALHRQTWDGVIDTSGFVPRIVRQSGELLRDAVGRYVFVSSISAYADLSRPYDESAVTGKLDDPSSEEVSLYYGPLKAACERVLDELYGDRTTLIRAGLIGGPYDQTDRFTYWPVRIAEDGDVLAPGTPDAPVQFIDARDLARWMIELAAEGPGGPINATGPATPLTMGDLLDRLISAIGTNCRLHWIDSEVLMEEGVQPWTELPLWLPDPDYAGLPLANIDRARAAGLDLRPVEQTAIDTLEWARTAGEQRPTLSREKERELLAKYAGT